MPALLSRIVFAAGPAGRVQRVLLAGLCGLAADAAWCQAPQAEESPTVLQEIAVDEATELETVVVEEKAATKLGPLEGLLLEKEQIPGNVQSLSGEEIKASFATSMGDLLNSRLQSINVNDYQGNPFQMDISFRGFSASPQLGTPQGLSVFVDGVRVNEPFGDVVNWDLVPMNALSGVDVFPGSNPLFGLNTLGGALSLRTKNGFDDTGTSLRFTGGSWDRKKGELTAGWNNGTLGGFIAFTGFDEEGWRQNSPSQVNQGFARLDLRGDNYALRFSSLLVGNELLGNGLVPTSLYRQDPSAVFTSPDATTNELQQFTLGGELFFNDELSLTGQIYRRDSSRQAVAGDIYEDFSEMEAGDLDRPMQANGTLTGDPVCLYQDVNHDGLPDYGLDRDGDGYVDSGTLNMENLSLADSNYLVRLPSLNFPCSKVKYDRTSGPRDGAAGDNTDPISTDPRHSPSGVVQGTPIGVISKTAVGQLTDGASLQLNWNGKQHKFMFGGSIDDANTDFATSQRLALIDASHRVYSDPSALDPIYTAGQQDIVNNSFAGKSTTLSAYFSETYSPWDNLHLSVSGRFNRTRVKNRMRARTRAGFESLSDIQNLNQYRPNVIVCPSNDPASCPNDPNYQDRSWLSDVYLSQDPYWGLGQYSETPTSEVFDYLSFNPSAGISYLPFKDQDVPYRDLNPFFNWSQGTRTPSSVELGCAYDGTLVRQTPGDPNSPLIPKSLASVGGACTLPTALSGDPYLPQIFADSYEVGLRGKAFGDWNWNAGLYRTDIRDDIYLVGITADRSFFDSIGETRRQGIEFGFNGKAGIADISVNYGYTDATFQSHLFMLSAHNSSAAVVSPDASYGQVLYDETGRPLRALNDMIEVRPGDRMPGIPLHNINASLNLHLTEQWQFGITMVAHSSSYARGNENNQHSQGAYEYYYGFNEQGERVLLKGRQFADEGKTPGYVVFHLKTRYEVGNGLAFFAMVNNLFDREYATASRLGANPFSPSIRGAVGGSGWNYNSAEWLSSTFIGPGAPRAYWAGVELNF
ncbi:TonB-dependent receptor [Methylomonas sp. HYX-M1]|uniref:TonB-dependent receptor n=1 Tax=Methylomonas sp. HYX-M1 TaxID=3139307 RepID=UPI00345BA2C6